MKIKNTVKNISRMWAKYRKAILKVIFIGFIIFIFSVTLLDYIKLELFSYYVNLLAQRTTLSDDLIKVLSALLIIPFWVGISYVLSIQKKKRYTGYAILITLYVFFFLGLHFATSEAKLGSWYVITDECSVEYFPRFTEYDPVTGQALESVTPDIIPYLRLVEKHGCSPINPHTAQFFNLKTGKPQVYYTQYPNGEYDFYYAQTYNRYGERTRPVTKNVIQQWENQINQQEKANQEQRSEQKAEQEKIAQRQIENNREEVIREEEEKKRQAEEAFRKEYINTSLISQLNNTGAISLIATDGNNLYETQIINALNSKGIDVRAGVIKNQIFKSNIFSSIVSGDKNLLRRLGLTDLRGNLIIYDIAFDEVKNPDGLLKSNAYLSISVIPLGTGRVINREFNSRGAGFDSMAAQQQSFDRVLEKLLNDPVTAAALNF